MVVLNYYDFSLLRTSPGAMKTFLAAALFNRIVNLKMFAVVIGDMEMNVPAPVPKYSIGE